MVLPAAIYMNGPPVQEPIRTKLLANWSNP
jgi:hypothetical protein